MVHNMFCTNCGKELKDGAVVCMNCGVLVKTNDGKPVTLQNGTFTVASADVVTKKKKPKVIIIAIVIAVLLIFGIIGSAFGSSDDEVIKSNSPTGASFNCTIDEFIDDFNSQVSEHLSNDVESESLYTQIKDTLQIKKDESVLSENNYIWTMNLSQNQTYSLCISTDNNDKIYKISLVSPQYVSDSSMQIFGFQIKCSIAAILPSESYESALQIITTVDNGSTSNDFQDNNVYYSVLYSGDTIEFLITANFD